MFACPLFHDIREKDFKITKIKGTKLNLPTKLRNIYMCFTVAKDCLCEFIKRTRIK